VTFVFYSPMLICMFPGPEGSKRVVVQCKGCRENIPAPVESVPAQPIAAKCPLCGAHRRYLPSEVFLGRLSHLMIRKPAHGRWAGGMMTPRFKGKPNFDCSLPCPHAATRSSVRRVEAAGAPVKTGRFSS
jgi:hypothetical protein